MDRGTLVTKKKEAKKNCVVQYLFPTTAPGRPANLHLASTGLCIRRELLTRVGAAQGKLLGFVSEGFMPLVIGYVIKGVQATSLILKPFWNEDS